MNWPPSSSSRKSFSSSAFRGAYWEWTSTSGIVTAIYCSGLAYAKDEIRSERENACQHDVFGVAEVVVEALVARAEPVARTRNGKRPDRRAEQRQRGVRREAHPEDAGRDGDERAN